MNLRNLVLLTAALHTAACSTTGGMYSESDPNNNQFSGWKTAGVVLLGIVTLGAVGAAAYAGAQDTRPVYYPTRQVNCTSTRYYRGGPVYTSCY